ncbi:hypothetical protein KIN20_014108 [Parelaphostrongylus tenuis]|nr:hypothetical protein KIN20_014108 [Parelaphostrongylus tenuis]
MEGERRVEPHNNTNQDQQDLDEIKSDLLSTSGRDGTRPQQTQVCHEIPRISAYTSSYSATPRGFLTRLSLAEIHLRIQQIKRICADDQLYPQELTYMLLLSGDITYGGSRPQEGQFLYTMEELPTVFGTSVPTIDARVRAKDFLTQMRRRALTVVAVVGYHFSLHNTEGTSYSPPVLPPLGFYRTENVNELRRVLGDKDDILLIFPYFLEQFQYGRGPIVARRDIGLVSSFRDYLSMKATRERFSNVHYEEHNTDPVPPAETRDVVNRA